MAEQLPTDWTVAKSAELYQIRGWGEPYFSIDEQGHAQVRPDPQQGRTIDLCQLTEDLQARGLALPLLIRFSDILADRIRRLNESFARAIREYEYTGNYRGVYPVKVNQQRHLVEEVVEFGAQWNYGLEAGSKPELLIALAAMKEPQGLIVCNGYKDAKYIEMCLLAQATGKHVIVVLERIEELGLVLAASRKLGLSPHIGIRAKLSSKGVGRWRNSAGDRAKFGLSSAEIVSVVDRLQAEGMLHCMELLHFHIGSQISSIRPLKNAIREAAHLYVELVNLGCRMGYLDVGGGLAVDYDGSKTDFHASKNYNMLEYAYDIVAHVQAACAQAKVAEPTLVSESGRAVAAHQSVLVFDVVGASQVGQDQSPEPPAPDAHSVLRGLYETWEGIHPKNVQEAWHDAAQAKEEAESLFKFGYLGLRERAEAERLFWSCCERIQGLLGRLRFVPEELQDLESRMAAIYYGNLSIFQSVPDAWAIDQLFPIMPIHRLDEKPSVSATLADLTCDSDGSISKFIDVDDVKGVLPVHQLQAGKPYFLGLFLNGAYQEILGDLHNLFGDTNAVHVRRDDDGYEISHVVKGDSVTEVLHYVQYAPDDMLESVRRQAERAHRKGQVSVAQMGIFLRKYEKSLQGYTYLTPVAEQPIT